MREKFYLLTRKNNTLTKLSIIYFLVMIFHQKKVYIFIPNTWKKFLTNLYFLYNIIIRYKYFNFLNEKLYEILSIYSFLYHFVKVFFYYTNFFEKTILSQKIMFFVFLYNTEFFQRMVKRIEKFLASLYFLCNKIQIFDFFV